MNVLVTIKTFTYAHEAAIVKARLEAEGIRCFLKDEFTVQANPFYSNALGGVKLQVMVEDLALANEVLKEADHTITQKDVDDLSEEAVEENPLYASPNGKMVCPYCGSYEVAEQRRPSGIAFVLSVIFLGFPIPFLSKKYHCYNCARDFKKK